MEGQNQQKKMPSTPVEEYPTSQQVIPSQNQQIANPKPIDKISVFKKHLKWIILIFILIGLSAYLFSYGNGFPKEGWIETVPFETLHPYNSSSTFGECGPYAGDFAKPHGQVINSFEQWDSLYKILTKNCFYKSNTPRVIDFRKQMLIAVFAGQSCEGSQISVAVIFPEKDKLTINFNKDPGNCSLPSLSYPFTLIKTEKKNIPIDFRF